MTVKERRWIAAHTRCSSGGPCVNVTRCGNSASTERVLPGIGDVPMCEACAAEEDECR